MNKLLPLLLAASLLTACNSKPTNDAETPAAPTAATADSAKIQQPTDEVARPETEGGTGDQTNLGTTTYVCPMGCEGSTSTKPGKCPVCEMDLEKKS
ncbi:hypothetical protein EJV47_25735 [Hymenobacter gummosus]|uniref:Heavy metal binding domain-containing protein n=1 Tax=Hymenobacter gummosus TaxID=1776032 RepID=A0A3S0J5S9_9BACT|nr:heavy metal-binding domain-containing protein [Hymenobacter gummosus]RTQ45283.1 hypothetical protein EJV47_25735 [Hymenobacter gummosus]